MEPLAKETAWRFGQHIARFGINLKNQEFREEKKWRLISPLIQEPHPQLDYRPSSFRVVPFFHFGLSDNKHFHLVQAGEDRLTVIVGPTTDLVASRMAVQFLLTSLVGKEAFVGSSEIPYRNW